MKTICQSCGMPLENDPKGGGSNADKLRSEKYCSFCFENGKFTDEGISLHDKIEKNIKIAVSMMKMSEETARQTAESILPNLERWKNSKF
jgi:hypothetical protein